MWPLAGPNIAKRVGSLQALARVDRQTHFGTFNFWLKPGFPIQTAKKDNFSLIFHDFFGDYLDFFRGSGEAALAADLITA